jgi:hypothetical protein
MIELFRRGCLLVVAGLATPAIAPAAAGGDCERILASDLPYAMRGPTVTIMDTTHREGVATFEVTRGEPTKVIVKIGPNEEPAVQLAYKGIFPTRSVVLKSNQVTEYDYATSIADALTPGAELRYTRVVKLNGEVSSTETGVAHVGERGSRAIGEWLPPRSSRTRRPRAPPP